jgi:hypothetical protein
MVHLVAIVLEWLFPQEKATFQQAGMAMGIVEPL